MKLVLAFGADHTQAHALLVYARDRGRKRIALVHDGEVYGQGLGKLVRSRAAAYGIEVVSVQRLGRAYSIDEFGDSTLAEYGAYTVDGAGQLTFAKTLVARP